MKIKDIKVGDKLMHGRPSRLRSGQSNGVVEVEVVEVGKFVQTFSSCGEPEYEAYELGERNVVVKAPASAFHNRRVKGGTGFKVVRSTDLMTKGEYEIRRRPIVERQEATTAWMKEREQVDAEIMKLVRVGLKKVRGAQLNELVSTSVTNMRWATTDDRASVSLYTNDTKLRDLAVSNLTEAQRQRLNALLDEVKAHAERDPLELPAVIVIAVDPGKITGAAVWNDAAGLKHAGQCELRPFLQWAEGAIPTYAPWDLEVVCETFVITQQTVSKGKDAHWAIGGLYMLEYWCDKYEVPFVTQRPSDAKSFATDEKLLRLGWHQRTPGGHRNDACRHLLKRLVDRKLVPLRDLTG